MPSSDQPAPWLPERPLERFLEIAAHVLDPKEWFVDTTSLRYAALGLTATEGAPSTLARKLRGTADQLKADAPWFDGLKGSIRWGVAAMVLRSGVDATKFANEIERIRELFRAAKIRRGSSYETLAAFILLEEAEIRGRRVSATELARFKAIYEEVKANHPWLTGADDYPCIALLCNSDESPSVIGDRVEILYQGLRTLGFSKGNDLQTVSHILFFNPASDTMAMQRFEALYDGFKDERLWMGAHDYDEVACLSFLDHSAPRVVDRVLEHRARIREKLKVGKQMGFNLACNTTFLELVQLDEHLERLTDFQSVMHIHNIIQAQQAAAASAAAGAAAAGAAAASS